MARILIVSVDRLFRALLGAELIERDHKVEGINTLKEALERLNETPLPPDVIIIEARGHTFDESIIPEIKRLSAKSSIIISAGPYDTPLVEFARFGIQHIAKKPLSIGELIEQVLDLLKKTGKDKPEI